MDCNEAPNFPPETPPAGIEEVERQTNGEIKHRPHWPKNPSRWIEYWFM